MAECPYCKEQIQDGAIVCRFCHRRQPSAPKRFKARYFIGGGILLFAIISMWAGSDYQTQQDRLTAASACSGISTDVLELAVQKKEASGQTHSEAVDELSKFVCPPSRSR